MELPVLQITQGVLFPEARIRVPIRSKSNLAMLDRFIINRSVAGKTLLLVAYRQDELKRVFDIGTIAMVEQVSCYSSSTFTQYTIHLLGVSRAKIINFALPCAQVKQLYTQGELSPENENELLEGVRKFADALQYEEHRHRDIALVLKQQMAARQLDCLTDVLASLQPSLSFSQQLVFLATLDLAKRAEIAMDWCKEREASKPRPLRSSSDERLRHRIISSRGGGHGGGSSQAQRLEQRLADARLPEQVKEIVAQDFERFKTLSGGVGGGGSNEAQVLGAYLEFVADLPWAVTTEDSVDIAKAREFLDSSHEGMESVKRRILEYMAVRRLRVETANGRCMASPILCLHGPPGCGKTSVARSFASALGRKFERISLGGIRDEADIRGHRRTYVGAMPGRLMQALRRAKVKNPVILLDEVDKLFAGINGSPSAALLEVLGPEQNSAFLDQGGRVIAEDIYGMLFGRPKTSRLSRQLHVCPTDDVIFSLKYKRAEQVFVTGSFVGWSLLLEMNRCHPLSNDIWLLHMQLPFGHHEFVFVVDGEWFLDRRLPTMATYTGKICHVLHIPLGGKTKKCKRSMWTENKRFLLRKKEGSR